MQETIKDVNNQLETIPYFYIIKHKSSGRKYAGCRFAKNCNPSELLTENGYKTSSNTIRKIITEEGLESFEIVEIVTDFGQFDNAYDFETFFLNDNNCANDEIWFNYHNNHLNMPYGTKAFKKLMIDKYGVDNYFASDEFKEYLKNYNLETYGCEYISQVLEIKEKIKITNLLKYGETSFTKTDEYIAKAINTNILKYGEQWYTQTNQYKNQVVLTNMEKYNYSNVSQVPEFKQKSKNTCMERYGETSFTKTNEYIEKTIQTSLEKYGTEFPIMNSEIKQKALNTLYDNYGVDHPMKNKDIYAKAKMTTLKNYGTEYYISSDEYSNNLYHCEYCNGNFKKMNYAGYHGEKCFKNPNRIIDKYVCSYCNAICFDEPQFLKNHQDNCRFNKNGGKYHPLKINICEKCNKCFPSNKNLMRHSKTCKNHNLLELPSGLFKCEHCFEIYDDHLYFINNHNENCSKNKNGKNYKPPLEKNFECDTCGKSYSSKDSLMKHITIHHALNKLQYACEYCNNTYSSPTQLKKHIRYKHLK